MFTETRWRHWKKKSEDAVVDISDVFADDRDVKTKPPWDGHKYKDQDKDLWKDKDNDNADDRDVKPSPPWD